MSQRFLDWIALRALEDSVRLQVALVCLGLIAVYIAVTYWPVRLRPYGKAAVITFSGVIYVFAFAFSLYTLGVSMGLVR